MSEEVSMPSEETVYFTDGRVTITNARAIIGEKTYAMINITSVSMGEIPPNKSLGIALILVGVLGAVCVSMVGESWIGAGVWALIVVGGGIWALTVPKPKYVVRIGSASGEKNALVSPNREYIQKIVLALNEAIIKRG